MRIHKPDREYLVLFISFLALFLAVYFIEFRVMSHTGGIFMYPLDDTFIHMAVAKTVAYHNTWGISANEFESASSSILYTIILASIFKIFSANVVIPFIVNAIAGVALLIALQRWLRKENLPARAQLIVLILIIFLTPIPVLIVTGMEHTLQCLFSFLFIFSFSSWMESNSQEVNIKKNIPWLLILLGVLVCAIRYEGLFLIAIASLILLYRKRYVSALLLVFFSSLPIILFGIYSLSKGAFFLPNSVLLKSNGPTVSLTGLFYYITNIVLPKLTISLDGIATVAAQHLLLILPISYLLFSNKIVMVARYKYILIMLAATSFLQICLASTGWFYRYEAYLIVGTVGILSVLIYKSKEDILPWLKQFTIAKIFLLFILFLPMFGRAAAAFRSASQACINIYEQQFQMAGFLHKYYDQDAIAVNDIGAVSFYKEQKNIDLYGLANTKIALSRKNNYCSPAFLDSFARSEHVKAAVVFDIWFSKELLSKWIKVASWGIPNNVICADSVVTFYAIDKNDEQYLRTSLEKYQREFLPAEVTVKYY